MVPRLRHNIAALGALQIANYLIPLVTLPYMTRALGVEAFGKVAFVQAVMALFVMLTDYGFSLSATQQIAANRNDRQIVSSIFSATWAAQWLLATASLILLGIAVRAIPLLHKNAELYLMGALLVIGNVLFPLWLMQGLERMRELAVIQISGRLLVIPFIFIFIKGPDDAILAVALVGLGPLLAGLISLVWVNNNHIIQFKRPAFVDISAALRGGSGLFFSKVTISLYTTLVPLVLGAVAGPAALACLNLADKARLAVQSALTPLSQALFPRMSYLYSTDANGARKLLKRSIIAVLIIGGVSSTLLWFFARWIIFFLGGDAYRSSASVLRYLAALPLVISLSSVAALQVLLPNKKIKQFNRALRLGSVLAILLAWPFSFYLREIGAALVWLVAEVFVCIQMWYFVLKLSRDGRVNGDR
jgi:O-antigen/teichoic acid export membrane protein